MSNHIHGSISQAGPWAPDLPLYPIHRSAVNAPFQLRHAPEVARPLSPREREVATLIADGYTNREIANALYISIATAERHTSNIFNKLGFHSRTRVAVWAIETGLALPRAS